MVKHKQMEQWNNKGTKEEDHWQINMNVNNSTSFEHIYDRGNALNTFVTPQEYTMHFEKY